MATNGNGAKKGEPDSRRLDHAHYSQPMLRSCVIWHLTGWLNAINMMRGYGCHVSNGLEAMVKQELRFLREQIAREAIKERGRVARAAHKGRVVQLHRKAA